MRDYRWYGRRGRIDFVMVGGGQRGTLRVGPFALSESSRGTAWTSEHRGTSGRTELIFTHASREVLIRASVECTQRRDGESERWGRQKILWKLEE